jgi:hypothetical protein
MKTVSAFLVGIGMFFALSMLTESTHEHGSKQLYESVACNGNCEQCNLPDDAKNC